MNIFQNGLTIQCEWPHYNVDFMVNNLKLFSLLVLYGVCKCVNLYVSVCESVSLCESMCVSVCESVF